MRDADTVRAQTRERVRKHRESKKKVKDVTHCNAPKRHIDIDIDIDIPKTHGQLALTSRFEEWWKIYPKKVKKADAKKKWKLKKLDTKADTLIADVANRIANDSQWAGGFIPHPTTYLNGERWNDEISVDTTKKLSYAESLAKDMRDKGML